MSHNFSTVSETLHLYLEQSYDLLLEESTATGNFNRVQISAWRQVSVKARRVYREDNYLNPPFLYEI